VGVGSGGEERGAAKPALDVREKKRIKWERDGKVKKGKSHIRVGARMKGKWNATVRREDKKRRKRAKRKKRTL